MILDIRGTNGSGKSYIMHELIKEFGVICVHRTFHPSGKVKKVIGTVLDTNPKIVILGKYEATCGGCDALGSPNYIQDLVRKFSESYDHVLLEGLLVSHTFGRWNDLAKELVDRDYRFLFLDTPHDVCVERVLGRRHRAGNMSPYDPKNLTKDWHQDRRVYERLMEAGRFVQLIDYRQSVKIVRQELRLL